MLELEYIYIKDKIREGMYYFIEDKRFVERTTDIELLKSGLNGLNGLIFDPIKKTINYVKTVINRKRGKIERRESHDFDSEDINKYLKKEGGFHKLIEELTNRYDRICCTFKNYSIYDLLHDSCRGYTVDSDGPTKEVIISKNDTNKRMYFYKNTGKVVAKSGNESQLVRGVEFSNVYDFTAFAEEVAKSYAGREEDFVRAYIRNNLEQSHPAESLATKLDKAQNDKQLNELVGSSQVSKYSKNGSEVKMNKKPKRTGRSI